MTERQLQEKNENDLIKNNEKIKALDKQIASLLEMKRKIKNVTLTNSKNEITGENESLQLPKKSQSHVRSTSDMSRSSYSSIGLDANNE